MHFHLPKPLHNWREVAGEVGVIVIGILIAIGLEQTVEWFHHRSEVREATAKLRAEALENRELLEFNHDRLQERIAQVDRLLAVLGTCDTPPDSGKVEPMQQIFFGPPSNTAWLGVRDSATLPLMPDNIVNNYWRIDLLGTSLLALRDNLNRTHDDARAAVETIRRKTRDPQACANAVFYLLRMKGAAQTLEQQTEVYRYSNEQAVEWVHHRSEVREATERLRAESEDNLRTVAFNLETLETAQGEVKGYLAVLGGCKASADPAKLQPLPFHEVFIPSDAAWLGIRDSDLLPLLPKDLADNYWKVDTGVTLNQLQYVELKRVYERANAAVERLRDGVVDKAACSEAVLQLHRLQTTEQGQRTSLIRFRSTTEGALRGERMGIDVVKAQLRHSDENVTPTP